MAPGEKARTKMISGGWVSIDAFLVLLCHDFCARL